MNKNYKKPRFPKPVLKTTDFSVSEDVELLTFLFQCYPNKGRNDVKSLLSNHLVLVNGTPISQFNFMLVKGDVVSITEKSIKPQSVNSKIPIVYEDDDFIAINKPYGLLSVSTPKEVVNTAYAMVTNYVQKKDKHNRIYIVHRIDEDTSGIMIFVKSEELRDALINNWNNLILKRGYYAIVEGHLKEKEGTFSSYLKKNSQYMMYSSKDNKGQHAVTNYKVINENKDYSLLDVTLKTGRKNQIRVHLFEAGHTVIGDDKYGEPSNPLDRLGLHAYELTLTHPFTKKVMTFKAPMPKEFKDFFKSNNK